MFAPPPLPSFSNPFADADGAEITRISLQPESGAAFAFPYNPTQFSLDRAVNWEDAKAMKEPYGVLNFTGGSSDTLSFTTMLDVTEGSDSDTVLTDIQKLYAFTKTSEKENNYTRPPILTLTWQGDLTFVGVISALKVDFTMFSEDGRPIRADITISMMGRAFSTEAKADKFFAPVSR